MTVTIGKTPTDLPKIDLKKLIVRVRTERQIGEVKVTWNQTLLEYQLPKTNFDRCEDAIKKCPSNVIMNKKCQIDPSTCKKIEQKCSLLKQHCQHILFTCPKLLMLCKENSTTCRKRLFDCEALNPCPWSKETNQKTKTLSKCLSIPALRFSKKFEQCSSDQSNKMCLFSSGETQDLKLELLSTKDGGILPPNRAWKEICFLSKTAKLYVFVSFYDDYSNSFALRPSPIEHQCSSNTKNEPSTFEPFQLICKMSK